MRIRSAVSKFFELPAKGVAMICYPCKGIERLGFRDGYNAFFCEPEDVYQCLKKVEGQNDLQVVVNRGQNLVWEKHSLHARINQFAELLNVIEENRFKGAYWNDGEFIIETK